MSLSNSEAKLYDALAAVMQTDHLVMDGEPTEGAVYRHSGEETVYESGTPVMVHDVFEIRIYQREFNPVRVQAARNALTLAGFFVRPASAETLENEYYRSNFDIRIRRD